MKPNDPRPMFEEICQQTEIIRELISNRKAITQDFVSLMKQKDICKIYLTGAGSPLSAAEVMRIAAIKLLNVDATAYPPSLFTSHIGFDTRHLSPDQMLLICPAESGHSKGQVDAARAAHQLNIPVACTTLNPTGVLARECDVVLAKPGEHEKAYVTTKGQTIALLLVLMCLIDAALALNQITEKEYSKYLSALNALPDNIEQTINNALSWFYQHEEMVMSADTYRFIGYGANFGTVNECALKIAESVRKPSFCYELEETLHGPMISMSEKDLLFLLATEPGYERDRTIKLAQILSKITSNVVVIQSSNKKTFNNNDLLIQTGDIEFIDAIEYMIPAQVIAFKVSDNLGIDTTIDPYDDLHKAMETKYSD